MEKRDKDKISVYIKSGKRAATSYYRFYQYLDKFGRNITYRKMLSDRVYEKVMPISGQPFVVKCIVFIYIYIRVLLQLTDDCFRRRPDILIVSRRFINLMIPPSYKFLLKLLKRRGTTLIWDFDDNIIESREISEKDFRWMENIADEIIVAGKENLKRVSESYQSKVEILPSTDGDMYKLSTPDVDTRRLALLNNGCVHLVWVGTTTSLKFVKIICGELETLGKKLYAEGKSLVFTVVCDFPLDYNSQNFKLRNVKWERDRAIREMLDSHVGLMPLEETDFTKGKGGFKLIQYLSVGLPVVGSPVGINCDIVDDAVGMLPASLDAGWTDALYDIVSDSEKWLRMSRNAKARWTSHYSYEDNLGKWMRILDARSRVKKERGDI